MIESKRRFALRAATGAALLALQTKGPAPDLDVAAEIAGLCEAHHVERLVRCYRRTCEAQELGRLTGMAVRFGPAQHYEGGLFGNAVLTRLPILDVVIHPLPYTESTPERVTYPRAAIAVVVRGPGERPIRFVSTHFQHNVPEDRVAEAEAVNGLFADPGDPLPTILAGDINAQPADEPVQVLQQRWTSTVENPPAPSAPSVKPTSRIDYIFYLPEARFRLVQAEVIAESMASDHRPVLAVVELLGQ